MSLWLSAGNAWAGAARGHATVAMRRQQKAATDEVIKQSVSFWSGRWMAPKSRSTPKGRR